MNHPLHPLWNQLGFMSSMHQLPPQRGHDAAADAAQPVRPARLRRRLPVLGAERASAATAVRASTHAEHVRRRVPDPQSALHGLLPELAYPPTIITWAIRGSRTTTWARSWRRMSRATRVNCATRLVLHISG